MMEAVYNAAGLGLPIVMTLANRAIGAPSIFGTITATRWPLATPLDSALPETNQEAATCSSRVPLGRGTLATGHGLHGRLHPDARRRRHRRADQRDVDAFLPSYEPRQVLDPAHQSPLAQCGPEAFTEVRYLSHLRQLDALDLIPVLASQFASTFGRESGG